MGSKMKGIFNGLKFISKLFVVKKKKKKQEIEIGSPTDVKHVAHIGCGGCPSSGCSPSWMSEFKPGPDFIVTELSDPRDSNAGAFSPWSSQDFDGSLGRRASSVLLRDNIPSTVLPTASKQNSKRKSTSSFKSSSSSIFSRAFKSKGYVLSDGDVSRF